MIGTNYQKSYMFSFYQQTEVTSLGNRRHTLCNLPFASTTLNKWSQEILYEIPNDQYAVYEM